MSSDTSDNAGASPQGASSADAPRKRRRRPVLRFVVVLVVLMVGFNALFYAWFSKTTYFESYLEVNARASAVVLDLLGEKATSHGVAVTSPRFALSIKRGCDAIQASVFFALLVAASPLAVPLLRRCAWMIGGTLVLLIINLVRIISLYYTGVWCSPETFEMMHVEVWQVAFIFLPIVLWLIWIRSLRLHQATNTHASA